MHLSYCSARCHWVGPPHCYSTSGRRHRRGSMQEGREPHYRNENHAHPCTRTVVASARSIQGIDALSKLITARVRVRGHRGCCHEVARPTTCTRRCGMEKNPSLCSSSLPVHNNYCLTKFDQVVVVLRSCFNKFW